MTHLNHFSILPASLRDLQTLRRLEGECFAHDAWPLWDLVAVLALPRLVRFKADVNGEMVGFAAGDPNRSEGIGWIVTMGVLTAHRGQGIGAALLAACEEGLKLPRLRLCVRVDNDPAISLYKKSGYHTIDVWRGYYARGEDALVMEKLV
jgi:ribosomal protein S18 acetylase RimI-like enzyme